MKRWILVAAVLGSGIVFLDSTIVNVALPRIGRALPRPGPRDTLLGPGLQQCLRGFDQSPGGINDVVKHQASASAYVADDVHDLGYVHFGAALVHDGHGGFHFLGEEAGTLHAAGVGGNHGQVRQVEPLELIHQHWRRKQVIHGNIEKALKLRRVQIHR